MRLRSFCALFPKPSVHENLSLAPLANCYLLIANCCFLTRRCSEVVVLTFAGRIPQRQLNMKRGPKILGAADANLSFMVADHRLHNGQSQPSAVLLGGVVRREQPGTFFRPEPGARVGKLQTGAP